MTEPEDKLSAVTALQWSFRATSTGQLYDKIYSELESLVEDARPIAQRAELSALLQRIGVKESAVVVEVGAGVGRLHDIHPGYVGIEHSTEGVERGRRHYGARLDLRQGDAAALPLADNSVDFLFSYATLEHVPKVDKAFAEIVRVLKPGAHAWLAPAWNCRSWTVAKLQQRPYHELPMSQKLGKFLIPLRENLLVRLLQAVPGRLRREIKLGLGLPVGLEWRSLQPDFSLMEKYPHIADDDAFVSMDAHAALCWFAARSFQVLSHSTMRKRIVVRSDPILVRKSQN